MRKMHDSISVCVCFDDAVAVSQETFQGGSSWVCLHSFHLVTQLPV